MISRLSMLPVMFNFRFVSYWRALVFFSIEQRLRDGRFAVATIGRVESLQKAEK